LRRVALALVAWLLLGTGVARAAEAPAPPHPDERWAYDLAHELMSPFCPGRALAECPSPQADELRLWILQQARAGATKDEVEAQLLQAFGDRMRQAPRAEGVGLVAYVVPAALVLAGGGLLWLFLRRQSRRAAPAAVASAAATPPPPAPAARDPELERLLDEELRP
jgi:cytochrome c-type biogenesis protein CcmH/NrfF